MIEFMGQSGFVWWFGVVEDIDDPLRLGRVRVRVFGYHTEDKALLKTADLPWAHPLQDITSASISGIGKSPTGLVAGSHVFGFFRDGKNAQQPVIMFSVGGIPSELPDKQKGFHDPSGTYPAEKNVADTNRLATGKETDKTVIETRKNNRDKDVLVALDAFNKEKWSEPNSPYKTKYPANKVFATQSGMVEEWDDTSGHERHHTYHPSGSFEEVGNGWSNDPNGTRVHKVTGNNYEIIAGSDFIHIKGSAKITLDGSASVYVGAGNEGGSLNLQVDKDVNLYVRGKVAGRVEGDLSLTVDGNYTERIRGNKYSSIGKNYITQVGGSFIAGASGNAVLKTASGSDLYLAGTGRGIKLNSSTRVGASDPQIPREGLP